MNKIKAIIKYELIKEKIKYNKINVVVYPFKTVGVQGDRRTYKHPIELEIISPQNKKYMKNA